MQIDASFCLGFQAFYTGFCRTGKEQAIDQGIGYRGDAGSVAAFLPGVTHHGYGFFMAHTDELFEEEVAGAKPLASALLPRKGGAAAEGRG